MSLEENLREITSKERVFDSADTLEAYAEDDGFAPRVRPRCMVKPESMEEVQKIVAIANETSTPLVPVSSEGPHFTGSTVPSVGGAVVVDLSSMNKVLRIDEKNKVAMIEPGVTFGKLKDELAKENLAPYFPLAPRASKSVLTSYLEREPITIPRDHWETQDPLLCTELVYGSGDLFRTGSAAGPGTLEEQWEAGRAMMRGYGPTQIDFAKLSMAAQGTMGILTWATVKCKRIPAFTETLLVPAEDISRLSDLAYKALWRRIGNQMLIINNQNLASLFASDPEKIEDLRDRLPQWILVCSFEGTGIRPEERVAWMSNVFREDAQKLGLEPVNKLAYLSSDKIESAISSPSSEPYWKTRYRGGNQDIFFVTTLDQAKGFIDRMSELAQANSIPATDIGVYLQPTVQGTNCHCEFNVPYIPKNAKNAGRVEALNKEAAKVFTNMGGFFSRPYGSWAQVAFGRDPATVTALRKVKEIFDPKGILNPGKLCF